MYLANNFAVLSFQKDGPAPGNYEQQEIIVSKPHVSSCFKSKTPRFSSSHTVSVPSFQCSSICFINLYHKYAHILLLSHIVTSIWASPEENLSLGVCKQQRRRPACASAQADQRLYYSVFRKYHI